MHLGIDENTGFIYEGSSFWGPSVWPLPIVSPANIGNISDLDLISNIETHVYSYPFIFREDSFDPVSRVRRGRLYIKTDQQPKEWHVYPHPAVAHENTKANDLGVLQKYLATFVSYSIWNKLQETESSQAVIVLGTKDRFTIWTILNIETNVLQEEIISLKARNSLGALPKVHTEILPEKSKDRIQSTLDKLSNDIYRAGPESIIDRCRDAASAILGAYVEMEQIGSQKSDLGQLISNLLKVDKNSRKNIVISSADTIRIFHSRAKPSVQAKIDVRPIYEQDAEHAVQCVGTILCELGWASWIQI